MAKAASKSAGDETTVVSRAKIQLVAKFDDSPDCYEIIVSRRRVAFIFTPELNIAWLPPSVAKITLTTKEKIAIAKWAPGQMADLTKVDDADEARLAELSAGRQA